MATVSREVSFKLATLLRLSVFCSSHTYHRSRSFISELILYSYIFVSLSPNYIPTSCALGHFTYGSRVDKSFIVLRFYIFIQITLARHASGLVPDSLLPKSDLNSGMCSFVSLDSFVYLKFELLLLLFGMQ